MYVLCVNKFVMEIKEATHLILPSDQTHYPNNTASKFKVKLPHTIRLASGLIGMRVVIMSSYPGRLTLRPWSP